MPHADIKYTSDIQIDLKTLMSDIEEIILGLDPTSGECKGRAQRVDNFHHSHITIEIILFAAKHRDSGLLNELINRVDSRAKSLLKKAAHVTVKLEFTPLTYLTGFYDPANPD